MKKVIPIKIVSINELKKGDLVSCIIVDLYNDDEMYLRNCHEWDVWQFNGIVDMETYKFMDFNIYLAKKHYLGMEGYRWTPSIGNKWGRWCLVKVIDDGPTNQIEDCNVNQTENGRPKEIDIPSYSQGKEKINQPSN